MKRNHLVYEPPINTLFVPNNEVISLAKLAHIMDSVMRNGVLLLIRLLVCTSEITFHGFAL